MGTVSRETLEALVAEFSLQPAAVDQFARLLEALAAEPDPHTTVSDPEQAIDVHLRDSLSALAVASLREARSLVDIGAGAGFPGLPLAIALPEARVDLVESASRKVAVIGRLASAAGVSNAQPVHTRVEEWARGERGTGPERGTGGEQGARSEAGAGYGAATARAVAPLAVLLEYAAPLLRVGGTFIAWKGSPDPSEVNAGASAAAELGLDPLDPLRVTPYPQARGLHLYLYSKVRETPTRYPRRAGMAAKRPLGA